MNGYGYAISFLILSYCLCQCRIFPQKSSFGLAVKKDRKRRRVVRKTVVEFSPNGGLADFEPAYNIIERSSSVATLRFPACTVVGFGRGKYDSLQIPIQDGPFSMVTNGVYILGTGLSSDYSLILRHAKEVCSNYTVEFSGSAPGYFISAKVGDFLQCKTMSTRMLAFHGFIIDVRRCGQSARIFEVDSCGRVAVVAGGAAGRGMKEGRSFLEKCLMDKIHGVNAFVNGDACAGIATSASNDTYLDDCTQLMSQAIAHMNGNNTNISTVILHDIDEAY